MTSDFTRIQWSDAAIKAEWQPKLSAISRATTLIERHSVSVNPARLAVLQVVRMDELPHLYAWAIDRGLTLLVLGSCKIPPVYSNAESTEGTDGYKIVICPPFTCKNFLESWRENNWRDIGAMLGYPSCCIEAFLEHWDSQNNPDISWQQNLASVEFQAECNTMLRFMGARLVYHLPCSFDCYKSAVIARRNRRLGYELGFSQEMEDLDSVLSWPIEFSELHGVAVTTTPFFRITSGTRKTDTVHEFSVQAKNLNKQAGYNGFCSIEAMHEAHRPVIEVVKTITQAISRSYWRVLDLGCGDGILLRKLTDIFPHVMPQGVEVDANKCLASNLHFDKVRIVRHANIKNFDISQAHPDIILCSIERLKEDSNLSQRLYSAGCKLILYDYLKVPTYVDIQG